MRIDLANTPYKLALDVAEIKENFARYTTWRNKNFTFRSTHGQKTKYSPVQLGNN